MAREAVREQRRPGDLARLAEIRWRHVRDVRRPDRPEEKVDHVSIGPSGIHVIGYRTHEPVEAGDAVLRDRREAARAVAALLPERYRSRTLPVLCFHEEVPVSTTLDEVLVTSAMTYDHVRRSSPVVLSTSEVNEVAGLLEARLEPYPVVPVQARRRPLWRRPALVAAALLTVAGGAGGLAGLAAVDAVAVAWPW